VLLSDLPHAGRVVSAKILECIAARWPVLAIGPAGEMWDLLRDYPGAHLQTPADTAGIADCLAGEIGRQRERRPGASVTGKAPATAAPRKRVSWRKPWRRGKFSVRRPARLAGTGFLGKSS
jgi:hypothetical protein